MDSEAITANGAAENMALAKNTKRDFDYLMSGILKVLQGHLLASIHFKNMYSWLLFLPSIFITLLSGILAVLVKASGLGFSERTQTLIALGIATLSVFSVFLQSLTKQLNLGGRANLHDSAAGSLRKIYEMTKMTSREKHIKKMQEKGSPATSSINEEDTEYFGGSKKDEGFRRASDLSSEAGKDGLNQTTEKHIDKSKHLHTLSSQYEQAVQGCESLVPIRIIAAFNIMESRVGICNQSLIRDNNTKPKIAWEKVYPALYHQLTVTIIGARGWPFYIPDPEWAVDKALRVFMDNLRCDEEKESDLLLILVNRALAINKKYDVLPEETQQVPETNLLLC